jgi:hypothetical protein
MCIRHRFLVISLLSVGVFWEILRQSSYRLLKLRDQASSCVRILHIASRVSNATVGNSLLFPLNIDRRSRKYTLNIYKTAPMDMIKNISMALDDMGNKSLNAFRFLLPFYFDRSTMHILFSKQNLILDRNITIFLDNR